MLYMCFLNYVLCQSSFPRSCLLHFLLVLRSYFSHLRFLLLLLLPLPLLSFQVLFIKVVKKLRSLSVEEQLIFNARVGAVEFNEDFFIIFPARKALYNVVFVNKDKANIAAVRVSKHRRSYDVYWTYHCYCAPLSTYIYLS